MLHNGIKWADWFLGAPIKMRADVRIVTGNKNATPHTGPKRPTDWYPSYPAHTGPKRPG